MIRDKYYYILLVTLFLAYSAMLAAYSHSEFPTSLRTSSRMPYLADKPVGEDGYYMLMVAWNLGNGKGVTGNEGEPVTGIQPLSTLIFASFASLIQQFDGSKWALPRAVIIFGALVQCLFAYLVGLLTSELAPTRFRKTSTLLGFTMALANFWLFRAFTYGLETGLYLTCLTATILFTARRMPFQRKRDVIFLGLLGGLCGWARIDFGVIFFVMLLAALILRVMSLRQVFCAGLTSLLLESPWLIYVYTKSGIFVPSSGPAQSQLIDSSSALIKIYVMVAAVIDHMTPWSYSVRYAPVLMLEVLSLLTLLIVVIKKKNLLGLLSIPRVYRCWTLGFIFLIPLYTVFFGAGHFYGRYISPILCVFLPVLAAFLAVVTHKSGNRILAPAFVMGLLLSFGAFAFLSLHTGKTGNPHSVSAGFVEETWNGDPRVGAWQSGVIGYFNDNVFNLDGKVSTSALTALKSGTIEEYIDNRGISVLIDWPETFDDLLDSKWMKQWELSETQPNCSSLCYVRSKKKNGF